MATFPVRSTDHVTRGIKRLLSEFTRATKQKAILGVYLARLQTLETRTWEIIDAIGIETSTGWLLRAIGKIVGVGAKDLTDELLRVAIRIAIRTNRAAGLVEDFLAIFTLARGDLDLTATCGDAGTAAFLFEIAGPVPDGFPAVLWPYLLDVKAAGVELQFTYPGTDTDEDWLYASEVGLTDWPVADDFDHGYGWTGDVDSGGRYGGVYSS